MLFRSRHVCLVFVTVAWAQPDDQALHRMLMLQKTLLDSDLPLPLSNMNKLKAQGVKVSSSQVGRQVHEHAHMLIHTAKGHEESGLRRRPHIALPLIP